MAKKPPPKPEENTGEWLNTYADMVTLLLTFFVLLFACSNLDETKLQYVFQEFKARGRYVNLVVMDRDPSAEAEGGTTDTSPDDGGAGSQPQNLDDLVAFLSEYVQDNNLSESVSVEQGETHIKIKFNSAVLFDGDSSYLKPEGKVLLDNFIPAIRSVKGAFARCTVSGHTSVGTSMVNDWNLSALRSVSVINYLEQQNMLESEKFRGSFCGPYEPDPDADSPAKNRRVEMLLLKNELDFTNIKVIQDILQHDFNVGTGMFDPDDHKKPDDSNLPPEAVDKIINYINEKFPGNVTNVGTYGPSGVDGSKFIPKDETSGGSDKTDADMTDDNADDDTSS